MSNIITIRQALKAFLNAKLGGEFNGNPLKSSAQSGIVFGEMEFLENQDKGTRSVTIGRLFPVLSRNGEVPDLEDAYEQALALSDKIALIVRAWHQNCSIAAARGANNFTASAQVLPIDNVRNILKGTDTTATTSTGITPIAIQPLTASYYAIAVVKFNLSYVAFED